jgi:hypothetical protein
MKDYGKMSEKEILILKLESQLRMEKKLQELGKPTLATLGFMTNDELMAMLKISRATAGRLRDSGELRFSKKGNLIVYKIQDVIDFLNSGFERH